MELLLFLFILLVVFIILKMAVDKKTIVQICKYIGLLIIILIIVLVYVSYKTSY
jgi:hypothetical protein